MIMFHRVYIVKISELIECKCKREIFLVIDFPFSLSFTMNDLTESNDNFRILSIILSPIYGKLGRIEEGTRGAGNFLLLPN